MNTPATRKAFVELLQLEKELEGIAAEVFQQWLDTAVPAALPGGLTAAADEPEEDGTIPPDLAALVAAAVLWETLVDTELLPRIGGVLDRLTDPFTERLTEWRTRYLASIRGRLLGAPDAAVRTVTAAVEQQRTNNAPVGRMRSAARGALSFARAGAAWAGRVGRLEAASAAAATREVVAETAEYVGRRPDTETVPNPPTVEEVSAAADLLPSGEGRLVKVWASMRDDRVRSTHRHADGQRRPIGDKFWVGGFDMTGPGDPFAPMDETAGCRCVLVLDREPDARVASVLPPGGNPMKTFTAKIIPTGVVGRSQGWMLAHNAQIIDTVLPMALKWQRTAEQGHDSAYTVGAITNLEVRDGFLWGTGPMLDTPEAEEAIQQIEAGVTRPSIELFARAETMTDGAGNPITPDTAEAMYIDGAAAVMRFDVAEVVAATLVSVPEFRDAAITLADAEADLSVPALVASAAVVEDTYDEHLFDNPLLDELTPIHLTDDGRVIGHLAEWGTCHVGRKDRCVEPPRSQSGYAEFHQSSVKLASGERLRVGRLTVGGGHARPGIGMTAATEHYDNVGTAWAFVRAHEDEHGIVIAGVLNPAADEQMVKQALGTPHSGHWEPVGGSPELIAACAVNSPGFPIAQRARNDRGELALVASLAPMPSRGVDTRILDEVAARAVKAYAEQQASQARAAQAAQIIGSVSSRRRVLADAIRESHAERKAS